MKTPKEMFTSRQFMVERYCEYYHYTDPNPPDIDFHQHPFYEIFVFLSGTANYIIEGKTYKLRPGDILLTSSQDIHKPEIFSGRPYERFVVWLSLDFFEHIKDFGEDLSTCFTDAAGKDYRLIRPNEHRLAKLMKIINRLDRLKNSDTFGNKALGYAYIIEFLVQMSQAYFDTPDSVLDDVTEDDKINQIIAYIIEHIAEELSLDQLSKDFYISKFYLSKRFKQYTGLSLYQYILKKRLSVARNILGQGVSVMDACQQCGFSDYSNFLKAFKREFGCTPTEYVRKLL